MTLEPKRYPYATSLVWTGERRGTLSCRGKPEINVACPPEWGGHPGIWSPEDLFIGSVEVCIMTTLLWLARRDGIELVSYARSAEGIAGMRDGTFGFRDIRVAMRIGVASRDDAARVGDLIPEIPKWCLVSRSLQPGVILEPEIVVEG